jgi:hypothetical protein
VRDHFEKTKHGVNASRAARYQCRAEAAEEKEKNINAMLRLLRRKINI